MSSIHNLVTKPTSPTTGKKEYKLQDHLGSTRVVIHESGTVTSRTDNDAWGEIVWQSGQSSRKGYIDKETDTESNLGDYEERKYDAGLGRFTSIDRHWENYPSLTPYQYAANNPLMYIDPTGLDIQWTGTEEEQQQAQALFDESVKFLIEKGAMEDAKMLLDMKYNPEICVTMVITDGDSKYRPETPEKLLEWNPYQAVEYQYATVTPAEGLLHEADHALQDQVRGGIDAKWHPFYGNTEEERVITGSETRVAYSVESFDIDSITKPWEKKAYEDKKLPTRSNHYGKPRKVGGPTKRK